MIRDGLMGMTAASQAEWMALIEHFVHMCVWVWVGGVAQKTQVVSMVTIKRLEVSGQG